MSEIMTHSHKMFDPLHPNAELIDITDIAHALSMLCRANGHFKSFYSVGQHCINCAKEAKARGYSEFVQLACLLHDASEAYLSDVTRPVKQELPRYLEIETPLQAAIWGDEKTLLPALRSLESVSKVTRLPARESGVTEVTLECTVLRCAQKELFTLLSGLNMPLLQLQSVEDTLEDVFLRCTRGE